MRRTRNLENLPESIFQTQVDDARERGPLEHRQVLGRPACGRDGEVEDVEGVKERIAEAVHIYIEQAPCRDGRHIEPLGVLYCVEVA
jgi:hypothetical protein